MHEIKKSIVSGYCDHLSNRNSITVTYAKVNVLGDTHSYQKLTSFSCDYANDCQKDFECPIVQDAMKNNIW
jgi:hypothetical protein